MYVDLSVPIDEQTPVYPGDPATCIEPAGIFSKDGYNDHYISIGTHVGTHIDAPSHMLEGGKALNEIPLDAFIGEGRLVDLVGGGFDAVRSANLHAGDIVFFRTGMSEAYHEATYFENYPVMSQEIADYLIRIKVKMVGVDACSVDNQDNFPIHKTLLGGNVLIVENLTNLDQLLGKKFHVYALPIKLTIDGAPARVIAKIQEGEVRQ